MDSYFSEYPYLSVKVKVASLKSNKEHFTVTLRGDLAQIEASSPLSAKYAQAQLLAGLQANRLGDFVGSVAPLFCLRPLWLESLKGLTVTSITDLGYNTLIIAYDQKDHEVLDHLRKSGIKIALYCTSLEFSDLSDVCDFIVWKQDALFELGFANPKKDATPFEQAQYELEFVQKAAKLPVCYYAKAKCTFLLQLLSALAPNSVIVFDAMTEGVLSNVFTEIAKLAFDGQMRLVAMLNISQIVCHEESSVTKRFSDYPMSIIENVLGRQKNGRFIGAACKVETLLNAHDFGQMSVWIVGQRMWRTINVHSLFETWLARYHPEWSVWFTPELAESIHALFRYKEQKNIEKGALALAGFAEILHAYKVKLRFQKISYDLEGFFNELFQLQKGFKNSFEETGTKAMCKIPLSLQNFVPLKLK